MAELHQQARALASHVRLASPTQWIPREQNSYADRLANEAMDAAADPPASIADAARRCGGGAARRPGPGNRGEPTRLLLLRHGQTELSVQRRYSGRGNPELTETGRRQADAAARYLAERGGIAAVDHLTAAALPTTPPRRRPRRSACDVAVDEDLIETDFGAWEGLTFREAAERDPELHGRWLRDTTLRPPGGESFDDVAHRVRRAQDRIIAAHPGQTVLVVSHVTPIKTLLRLALDAGAEHPAPAAPGPGVAEHRRVLSRRRVVGAAGQPDVVSGLRS